MNVNTGEVVKLSDLLNRPDKSQFLQLTQAEHDAMRNRNMGLEERVEHVERSRPGAVAGVRAAAGSTFCPSVKERFKQRAKR